MVNKKPKKKLVMTKKYSRKIFEVWNLQKIGKKERKRSGTQEYSLYDNK